MDEKIKTITSLDELKDIVGGIKSENEFIIYVDFTKEGMPDDERI